MRSSRSLPAMRSSHRNGPSGGPGSGKQKSQKHKRPAPVAASEAERGYPAWLDDITEVDLLGDD